MIYVFCHEKFPPSKICTYTSGYYAVYNLNFYIKYQCHKARMREKSEVISGCLRRSLSSLMNTGTCPRHQFWIPPALHMEISLHLDGRML